MSWGPTRCAGKRGKRATWSTLDEFANSATKKVVSSKIGYPEKKMKGRSVLLGDNVKDQDFNWAEFLELGSSPPTIQSAPALDAMGSLPRYRIKKKETPGGASTQSVLRGAET